MCKDPYFNAQVCRLLVIVNVILCILNVILFLTNVENSVSILHAVFNLLVAAWMLYAFKFFKKRVVNERDS